MVTILLLIVIANTSEKKTDKLASGFLEVDY